MKTRRGTSTFPPISTSSIRATDAGEAVVARRASAAHSWSALPHSQFRHAMTRPDIFVALIHHLPSPN
jgi:hypothetical protein